MGWYVGKPGKIINDLMAGLVNGSQPGFKRNELEVQDLPDIEENGWKYLKPVIYTMPDVLIFHAQRFHKKGLNAGKIILDD